MFSRERKTFLAEWWWTVDRELLVGLGLLLLAGIVLSFAASPAVAERLGKDEWYFIIRHIGFTLPAVAVMIGVSMLSPRQVRLLSLAILGASIVGLLLTQFIGFEVKGAQRWLSVGPISLQPSEFVKPAFAIMAAWLLAAKMRSPEIPAHSIVIAVMAMIVGLLVLQPDIGQTALILLTWAGLLFIAGISWWLIAGLGATAIAALVGAYVVFPHVARRIDSFINPAEGDNYQVEKALQSFNEGGWFGRGPGEGLAKRALPDAHADFVFSAAAGEFGILFCMALVTLIVFVAVRGLWRAQALPHLFERLAVSVLALQFGLQSAINLAVNVNLMPPKGMTLPFVSYGGTSMLAVAFAMGAMLAMMRRNPQESFVSGLPLHREALRHGAQ